LSTLAFCLGSSDHHALSAVLTGPEALSRRRGSSWRLGRCTNCSTLLRRSSCCTCRCLRWSSSSSSLLRWSCCSLRLLSSGDSQQQHSQKKSEGADKRHDAVRAKVERKRCCLERVSSVCASDKGSCRQRSQ
jgi:hypothetical protein